MILLFQEQDLSRQSQAASIYSDRHRDFNHSQQVQLIGAFLRSAKDRIIRPERSQASTTQSIKASHMSVDIH